MKKFISLALVAAMVLSMTLFMASCGDKEGGDAEAGLRIRCVIATELGDQSFNDSAKGGIDKLVEMGYDAKIVECHNDANTFEQNMRTAADDADIVIGVGSELNMIGTVATDYPDVKFIWCDNVVDDLKDHENLTCISYAQNEGSYLVGWIAGKTTESDTVGFVGGQDIPVINDFFVGYKQGAIDAGKDMGKDIKVVKNYTGDWGDTNLGAEAAQTLTAQGADILFCAAGGSGNGAIMKAKELGIKCIGVDQDQRITLKKYADDILCSMLKQVGDSIVDVVTKYDGGDEEVLAGANIYLAGLDAGAVGVGYGSEDQEKLVSDDLIAEVEAKTEEIKAGDIVVDTAL